MQMYEIVALPPPARNGACETPLKKSLHMNISRLKKITPIFFAFNFVGQEPPLLGPGAASFTPYGPPEYHQNAADVGASANAAAWKPPPVHPAGLMKDPPIAPAGRNGPANFVAQGQQQGAVMMVYGLDNDTSNTDKLFNLVCLYGNVARVSTTDLVPPGF